MTTTRKTNATLCPMTRKECLFEQCMLWDDECRACGLDAINLYHKIREAVTDAAVDLVNAYAGGDLHG